MALTSFAAVQKFFNDFIAMNPGIDIADAQHHAFWNTTYDNFVNGNVPNVTDPTSGQPLAILNKVNGKYDGPSSNIVMALAGTANSLFDPNNPAGIGQMPKEDLICPPIRSTNSRTGSPRAAPSSRSRRLIFVAQIPAVAARTSKP